MRSCFSTPNQGSIACESQSNHLIFDMCLSLRSAFSSHQEQSEKKISIDLTETLKGHRVAANFLFRSMTEQQKVNPGNFLNKPTMTKGLCKGDEVYGCDIKTVTRWVCKGAPRPKRIVIVSSQFQCDAHCIFFFDFNLVVYFEFFSATVSFAT